jgi:hypothetical protein
LHEFEEVVDKLYGVNLRGKDGRESAGIDLTYDAVAERGP